MSKMAVLVLASGLSKRFGAQDKLMAEVKGQALLAYCLDAARGVNFDGYYVVTPDPDPRASLARSLGFKVIHNPTPEAGQGASIAAGVKALVDQGYDAVCILLGDMPMITSKFIERLKRASDTEIIFSRANHRDGPPAIFKGSALGALMSLTGDKGARSIDLSNFNIDVLDMPPELAIDFDTPEDFQK